MEHLSTIDDVVERLGGPTKAGRIVGRGPQAVCNWVRRGRIAPDTFCVLRAALEEINCTAPKSLWGMVETEEAAP